MPLAPIVVTPPLAKHPELRIPCRGGRLFPLIYRLATLDVMTPPDLQTLQEVVSPNRLFSYGNPFYGLYFQDLIEFAPGTAILFIMVEAQAILLCEHFPPPPKLSRPQILVVLGFITQTQVSTTSPLHSELISSHAAHCMYINFAEDYVISHYPSRLVVSGDVGGMATSIILLRAMHSTKKITYDGIPSIPCGSSARLVDFLQTLTGEDAKEIQFGSMREEEKDILLERGRIFFNQFNLICYTPNASDLLKLLHRGLAAQCKPHQPGLDHLFTIYLVPELPKPTVQPKSESTSTLTLTSTSNLEDPILLDYLIMLFNLRAQTDRTLHDWSNPPLPDDNRRVCVEVSGLEEIDCLTPAIRTALFNLLASESDVMQLQEENAEYMLSASSPVTGDKKYVSLPSKL
ncbi:hypothetical protein PCANC_22652 [Puccinia coronata f. sp. avenae]|uniref:Uncharacterized protein n=1 Tax=Puccinia coronata f. sp. avenae TaxID=200324 RepID=A0A2N5SBR1_9BASI|nr:hypothetical protein PCANC_22652 [Puccinia coronata f. sp. avenae]